MAEYKKPLDVKCQKSHDPLEKVESSEIQIKIITC